MTENGFRISIYVAFLLVPVLMALYALSYALGVITGDSLLQAHISLCAMLLAFAGGEYLGTLLYTFLDSPKFPAHEPPLLDCSSLGLILLFLAFISLNSLAQANGQLIFVSLAQVSLIPGFVLIMLIDRRLLHYKIQPSWFTQIRFSGCAIALAALAVSGVRLYGQVF